MVFGTRASMPLRSRSRKAFTRRLSSAISRPHNSAALAKPTMPGFCGAQPTSSPACVPPVAVGTTILILTGCYLVIRFVIVQIVVMPCGKCASASPSKPG